MSRTLSRPFAEPCSLTSRTGGPIALLPALVVFVAALPLAGGYTLPATVAMLAAAIHALSRLRSFAARRVTVGCTRDGRWWMGGEGDRTAGIDVSGASVASRAGLFLVYRRHGARWHRALYLPGWRLDPEAYRRIRVRLRITAGPPAEAPATWFGRW